MFFMKPNAAKLRQQDLEEAERELGAHRKSEEYHWSMASMYELRVARLKEEIEAAAAYPIPPRPASFSAKSEPTEVVRNG